MELYEHTQHVPDLLIRGRVLQPNATVTQLQRNSGVLYYCDFSWLTYLFQHSDTESHLTLSYGKSLSAGFTWEQPQSQEKKKNQSVWAVITILLNKMRKSWFDFCMLLNLHLPRKSKICGFPGLRHFVSLTRAGPQGLHSLQLNHRFSVKLLLITFEN